MNDNFDFEKEINHPIVRKGMTIDQARVLGQDKLCILITINTIKKYDFIVLATGHFMGRSSEEEKLNIRSFNRKDPSDSVFIKNIVSWRRVTKDELKMFRDEWGDGD